VSGTTLIERVPTVNDGNRSCSVVSTRESMRIS
jgi:hypothetical protein